MKKLAVLSLLAIAMFCFVQTVSAQSTSKPVAFRATKAALAGTADTSVFGLIVPSSNPVTGIAASVKLTAGSFSGGQILLEGAIDSTGYYDRIDSIAITNVALNKKTFTLTNSPYFVYRVTVRVAGTGVAAVPRVYFIGRRYYE